MTTITKYAAPSANSKYLPFAFRIPRNALNYKAFRKQRHVIRHTNAICKTHHCSARKTVTVIG